MTAKRILLTLGVLALVALGGPARAQDASVSAVDNEFVPRNIEVSSGSTVTWTNDGDVPHTVTADNGSFESGNLDPGDSFETEFTQPGTYSYYCEYHGGPEGQGMSGVVTVTGGGNGGPDDPTDPPDDNGTGNGDDETTEDPLPETGADVLAFVYLALVLIAMGGAFLRLERA